jgi:hypothetical protein
MPSLVCVPRYREGSQRTTFGCNTKENLGTNPQSYSHRRSDKFLFQCCSCSRTANVYLHKTPHLMQTDVSNRGALVMLTAGVYSSPSCSPHSTSNEACPSTRHRGRLVTGLWCQRLLWATVSRGLNVAEARSVPQSQPPAMCANLLHDHRKCKGGIRRS